MTVTNEFIGWDTKRLLIRDDDWDVLGRTVLFLRAARKREVRRQGSCRRSSCKQFRSDCERLFEAGKGEGDCCCCCCVAAFIVVAVAVTSASAATIVVAWV